MTEKNPWGDVAVGEVDSAKADKNPWGDAPVTYGVSAVTEPDTVTSKQQELSDALYQSHADTRAMTVPENNQTDTRYTDGPVVLTKSYRAVSPGKTTVEQPYAKKFDDVTREDLSNASRVLMPGLMAGLGSAAGTVAGGPIGGVAGGALMYSAGNEISDLFDNMLGLSKPKSVKEELGEAGGRVIEGAVYEGLGLGVSSTLSGVGKGVRNVWRSLGLSEKAAQKRAADIYIAMTGNGVIYTDDIARAKVMADKFGLRFRRGQLSGDSNTVAFEKGRAVMSQEVDKVMRTDAEYNTAQMLKAIEDLKTPGSKEELSKTLTDMQNRYTSEVANAQSTVSNAMAQKQLLHGRDMANKGSSMVKFAKEAEKEAKGIADTLYKNVDNVIVDDNAVGLGLLKAMEPEYAAERASNFPKVVQEKLDYLAGLKESGEPLTVKDLKGWRTELLDEARNASTNSTASTTELRRLNNAATHINNMLKGEDMPPDIRSALEKANTFYKTEVLDRFYTDINGKVVATGNRAKLSPVELLDAYFVKGPKGQIAADEFKNLTRGNAEAMENLKAVIAQDFVEKATDPLTKQVSSSKLNSWVSSNRHALEAYGLSAEYNTLAKQQALVDTALTQKAAFDKSVAAKVLGDDVDNVAKILTSSGRNTKSDELLLAIRNNPSAVGGVQNAVIDEIISASKLDLGKVNISGFINARKRYSGLLDKLSAIQGGESKSAVLKQAQDMLSRIEQTARYSKTDIDSILSNPMRNQVAINRTFGNRALGVIAAGLGTISKYGDTAVAKFLNRAAIDPDFAETLLLMKRGADDSIIKRKLNEIMPKLFLQTTQPLEGVYNEAS